MLTVMKPKWAGLWFLTIQKHVMTAGNRGSEPQQGNNQNCQFHICLFHSAPNPLDASFDY